MAKDPERPTLTDLEVDDAFEGLACLDGDCAMFSEGEDEDLEIVHRGANDAFDCAIECMEDIMLGDGFEATINAFCRKNSDMFEDTDENKLEYTSVFQSYVKLIEKTLEEKLVERLPSFDMGLFLEHMEARSPEELCGDVFDMLLTATDFDMFKAHMLSFKTESAMADLMPATRQLQLHVDEQETGDARPDLDSSLCVSPVGLMPQALKI